jgi:hypothetical protein
LQVPRLSVENSLTDAFLKNGDLVETVTSFGMRRIFPDWRFKKWRKDRAVDQTSRRPNGYRRIDVVPIFAVGTDLMTLQVCRQRVKMAMKNSPRQ